MGRIWVEFHICSVCVYVLQYLQPLSSGLLAEKIFPQSLNNCSYVPIDLLRNEFFSLKWAQHTESSQSVKY